MGDPKKIRSRLESPLKAWDKGRIVGERAVLKEFGLRRKRELRRAEAVIRAFRRQARELGASKEERRQKELLARVSRLNLVRDGAGLDDVLGLTVQDVLSRRLQTVVYKKGLANSLKQARQLITHGHVTVGRKRVSWPSFIVTRELEDQIRIDVQKK